MQTCPLLLERWIMLPLCDVCICLLSRPTLSHMCLTGQQPPPMLGTLAPPPHILGPPLYAPPNLPPPTIQPGPAPGPVYSDRSAEGTSLCLMFLLA